MPRMKLIFLNVACFFILSYFLLSAFQYLFNASLFSNSDYIGLYKGLHQQGANYHAQFLNYLYIDPMTWSVDLLHRHATQINVNTPTMTLLIKGLVSVFDTLKKNVILWITLSSIASAIAVLIMMRWLHFQKVVAYYIPWLTVFFLWWVCIYNLVVGQVSMLLLPMFCAVFFLDENKHPWYALFCLAFLSALKLFFLIFSLLYVMNRQWRFLFVFIGAFFCFFFLGKIYFSWHEYLAFYHVISNRIIFMSRSVLPMNGSILGFMTHLAVSYGLFTKDIQVSIFTTFFSIVSVIGFLIFDYRYVSYCGDEKRPLRYAFLMTLAILISPLGWLYYFVFLLVSIFVFYRIQLRYAVSPLFFFFLFLAMILPFFAWLPRITAFATFLSDYASFVSLLCWLVCNVLATVAVIRGSAPMESQRICYLFILGGISLASVVLLGLNYGFSDFLNGLQKLYLESMPNPVFVK